MLNVSQWSCSSRLRAAVLLPFLGLLSSPAVSDPTLAGGLYHSMVVDSAGRVLSWGEDGSGQLGTGRATFVATPTAVTGQPGGLVLTVSAGVFHSVALLDDGRVLARGKQR